MGHPDVAFVSVSKVPVVERKTDPKIGTRDPGNDGALEAPGQSWDVCMPCLVPVLKQKQCRSEGHGAEQGWGRESHDGKRKQITTRKLLGEFINLGDGNLRESGLMDSLEPF